ncbi:MAG: tRNA (N6-isopentenyl adenosine(37)-C2)-methylthiotransferase MiaB [Parcubacteria group bacterium]|jgi:tRNA-2-methylthio-N6-dimethylallyladenosine synthase
MKYYIKTFGCQMNVSDSERISGFLEAKGYKSAQGLSEAALAIFNTCGVRQMAEDRVYGQIHNLRKAENANPRLTPKTIILTGCLANRADVQKRLKNKVDLFCEIKDFPKEFKKILKTTNHKLQTTAQENIAYLSISPKHKNNFSAYVPIMTGCNNFCAYCVVPYARGREVSRPAAEILAEIKSLIKKGYKEIILLGQNVNSYKDKKINFSQLLKKVDAIHGNFWIQFMSNHPKDVTDEMIETVAKLPKVFESFHLPIQAGSDEIIRKMNRKYTAKQYLTLVKKIKKAYQKYKPDLPFALTSDIIVGFPGETKKQFMDSAKIMKLAKYDMVFFGQFSPRPGTAAWQMKDNISKAEKVRREQFLNEILKKTVHANNKKYVEQVLDVLVENKKDDHYFGRTRTMKNVKIVATQQNLIGKIVKAKITKANTWNLEGKLS